MFKSMQQVQFDFLSYIKCVRVLLKVNAATSAGLNEGLTLRDQSRHTNDTI